MFQFLKSKKILIVGCGRFGSTLASELSKEDYDVTIIDLKESAFQRLPDTYTGFQMVGDACDQEILEQYGITHSDIVIAVTNSDNINCMIAQIAYTIYHVENVYVRLYDVQKETLLQDTNIKAIYPTKLCLSAFLEMNHNQIKEHAL